MEISYTPLYNVLCQSQLVVVAGEAEQKRDNKR